MKAKLENIENKLVAKLNCTDFQYSLTSNNIQYDLQVVISNWTELIRAMSTHL